jgi:hypothetical protein
MCLRQELLLGYSSLIDNRPASLVPGERLGKEINTTELCNEIQPRLLLKTVRRRLKRTSKCQEGWRAAIPLGALRVSYLKTEREGTNIPASDLCAEWFKASSKQI